MSALRLLKSERRTEAIPARKYLRLAKNGDREAFASLIGRYADTAAVYFQSQGPQSHSELETRLLDMAVRLWRCLAYAHRVSDFERMLFLALERVSPDTGNSPNALFRRLYQLSPTERFVLIAREMEEWSLERLEDATRMDRRALRRRLMEARAKIADIDLGTCDEAEQEAMQKISNGLDQHLTLKKCQRLSKQTGESRVSKRFKGQWLECRCDLVDQRQRLRLDAENRESLMAHLDRRLAHEDKPRANFTLLLRNSLRFNTAPELEAV